MPRFNKLLQLQLQLKSWRALRESTRVSALKGETCKRSRAAKDICSSVEPPPASGRADYKRTCRARFNDVPQRRLPNSGKIGITNTAKKFCRGPSQSAASFQSSSCRFRLLSSTGQRVGGILLGGEQDEGVGPHHLARWNPSLSGAAAARHRRVSARDRASGRGFAVVMAPSPYCCPCAYFIRSRILVITDPNAHRNKIEI